MPAPRKGRAFHILATAVGILANPDEICPTQMSCVIDSSPHSLQGSAPPDRSKRSA
jgi:hypothetical protein